MEHRRGHAEGASGNHDRFAGWVARYTFRQAPGNAECTFKHAAELAGVAPQGRGFQAADHFTRGWRRAARHAFGCHIEIGQNQAAFFSLGRKK
jgi:hypothetical protein